MTDADRALRDAWLSEMWAPVREWHPGQVSQSKCKECGKPLEKRAGRGAPRQYCMACKPRRAAA